MVRAVQRKICTTNGKIPPELYEERYCQNWRVCTRKDMDSKVKNIARAVQGKISPELTNLCKEKVCTAKGKI